MFIKNRETGNQAANEHRALPYDYERLMHLSPEFLHTEYHSSYHRREEPVVCLAPTIPFVSEAESTYPSNLQPSGLLGGGGGSAGKRHSNGGGVCS